MPNISPIEQTSRNAIDLIATIDEIKSLEFIKSDFETEAEYFDRVSQLYSEYDARRYEFELGCSHKEENFSGGPQAALTSYDVNREVLTLNLARPQNNLVPMQRGSDVELNWHYYSFIEVTKTEPEYSAYTASNSFGREVEVVKVESEQKGVALLFDGVRVFEAMREVSGSSNPAERMPLIEFPLSRDVAEAVFSTCRVVFDIQSAFNDIWPIYRYNFISQSEDIRSMLFAKKTEVTPTIARPAHIIEERFGIPVYLLSVSVTDESGDVLYRKEFNGQ
ncbi:MAG: hypothetical protein Q8K17_00915 [Pseudohongiella sp.]|nr:hypothetical protein [Pseudohongiella sp.]MDP2091533.1 hypothetical protein [Pseudohongiella sp.]